MVYNNKKYGVLAFIDGAQPKLNSRKLQTTLNNANILANLIIIDDVDNIEAHKAFPMPIHLYGEGLRFHQRINKSINL
jgi:hypothetical protein